LARVKRLDRGSEVLSSDLTCATDTIPLDVIKALREGLLQGLRDGGAKLTDWFVNGFRSLTGP
jgi:hypothetical protein